MFSKKKVTNNVVMLYLMNIAQLILPLVTLPYLARVLSVTNYGVVSYVKNVMMYASLIIEFGYSLSGTREIVEAAENKARINKIVGKITIARLLLSCGAIVTILVMIVFIKILRNNALFTLLMLVPSILTVFLFDFLFRGLEKMQVITFRYIIMKGTAAVLTFVFVKGDKDILYIPILDIIGSIIAIMWVFNELKKMNIRVIPDNLRNVWLSLKDSFTYFLSNMASTAFGAFNTIIVGIFLSAKDVAYWSMLMTLITAVQSLYYPISDGIYPQMIKHKSLKLFRNILLIFTPILILGCCITYFGSTIILLIIGGHKYTATAWLLRMSVPLLFVSFYSVLCGWPLLGAIGKINETTFTTISAALVQVVFIIGLIVTSNITLVNILIIRIFSELLLLLSRVFYFKKSRELFN